MNAAEKDNACIKCRSCGHNVAGTAAPEICPVCAHPQSCFELNAENC